MSFNPQPPGGAATNNRIRTDELYGGDPTAAMMAIMREMNINPFRSNPFVQRLLQTAPGLQSAWQLSNIGAKNSDIQGEGGVGNMFGNFLRSQLQGGDVFGTLANASSNLGNYAGQMRSMYDKLPTMNQADAPPFLKELDEMLSNPMALAKMIGSLNAPGLGPLGQSYESSLRSNIFSQAQNRLRPPDQGGQEDLITDAGPTFFEWIMGRRR